MSNATPVVNHSNNLDGIGEAEAAQSAAFLAALGEHAEELPQEETEEVEEEVIEEEAEEEESEEEEVSEESDEETEEEEAEESEEETPESEVFLVKVNGEEVEVSEDELLGGYQRQQDYTRKTQELATERARTQEFMKTLEAERDKYVTALDQLIDEESKSLKKYDEIDWNKLRAEDQNQFLMLQFEMNEQRGALQSKIDNRKQALEQSNAEKAVREKDYLDAQQRRAEEIVEGWNGENHSDVVKGLREQTEALGFNDEDQELLKHAMVIKLLQKAKAFDDFKASQSKVVEKKIKRKVPKVVKSGKASTGKGKVKSEKDFHRSMEQLRKTGNIKDSVSAFEAFL